MINGDLMNRKTVTTHEALLGIAAVVQAPCTVVDLLMVSRVLLDKYMLNGRSLTRVVYLMNEDFWMIMIRSLDINNVVIPCRKGVNGD